MDGTANEHPRAKVCITALDGWFWLTIRFLENGLALGFIKTVMLEKMCFNDSICSQCQLYNFEHIYVHIL